MQDFIKVATKFLFLVVLMAYFTIMLTRLGFENMRKHARGKRFLFSQHKKRRLKTRRMKRYQMQITVFFLFLSFEHIKKSIYA